MNRVSLIAGTYLVFASIHLHAAGLWTDIVNSSDSATSNPIELGVKPFKSRLLTMDTSELRKVIDASTSTSSIITTNLRAKTSAVVGVDIPLPDGSTEKYSIKAYSILSDELVDKYPDIKMFRVRGIDTPTSSGILDITPNGFHGFIYTDKGLVFIDPVKNAENEITHYRSYYKKDYVEANQHLSKDYSCGTRAEHNSAIMPVDSTRQSTELDVEVGSIPLRLAAKTSNFLYTYRLAVAATAEYTSKVGAGDRNIAFAEIMTAIARVNEIFINDLAIRLILVSDENLVFTDSATDGYTNGDLSLMLQENQSILDNPIVLGRDNYDIGHVFGSSGGGLAQIESACIPSLKAYGASTVGVVYQTGDPFYLDVVAHELGHQFGADHSFNGTSGACAATAADPNDPNSTATTPRNPGTAYEPGSGNTIMAYSGLCEGENIQAFSDANFHAGSIDEIISYTRYSYGRNCKATEASSASPVVDAGTSYVIPLATPFTLTGTATDNLTETLTYQWQQMDVGAATDATTFGTDLGSNPLFITHPPVSHGKRTFPQMAEILFPTGDKGEVLPTKPRTMNFRLLVRDGNGGVDGDNIQVRATAVAGPFKILQPNTSLTLDMTQPHVVKWDTSCTAEAPVNCANVDILFSSDGGTTFDETLASATPNDGEEQINFFTSTTQGRIKIMCSNNIFFDVSDVNFAVAGSGATLVSTGAGGNSSECAVEPAARRSGAMSLYILFGMLSILVGVRMYRTRF